MNLFLIVILGVNSFLVILLYFIMRRKRKLFSERFGAVLAMSGTGIFSLNIGLVVHLLVKDEMSLLSVLSILIGGLIGFLFGSLVKFQSILTGFTHGVVGGIMGTMLAAVILNPSLCNLPSSYLLNISQNIMIFSVFGTILSVISMGLLCYSLRV